MTLRASFTFRNQGGATATGVRVRFNVPDGLVYLVGSGKVDGAVVDDKHGASALLARAGAEIGDVAPGEERSIEIAYSVAGAIENGTTVELQAAVSAFELAPVGSNIVRLIVRSKPLLENPQTNVAFENREGALVPGAEAAITVRVHNAGESSAREVVVVAPVPQRTSYVANSARVNGREFERDLLARFDRVYAPVIAANLPASATVTLSYRVRVDDRLEDLSPIAAFAQIASQETAAFALQPAALPVRAAASFDGEESVLTVEPENQIASGDTLRVRLRATNVGGFAAEAVSVTFEFSEGLLAVRGSAQIDGRPLRERKKEPAQYDLGRIPPQGSAEVGAIAIARSPLTDGDALRVRARLRWQGGEREFERTILARSLPAFAPRRSRVERIGSIVVRPSQECRAALSIVNDGSAPANDAVLQLSAEPGLEDVCVYEKGAGVEMNADSLDLGALEPYESREFVVAARARTPCEDRTPLCLSALLHTQELGETPLGEARWQVESHPAFSARTSALSLAQDDVFRPNQLVDVYVRLRNEGTDVAQNVRLLLYVSAEARLESVEGATRDRSTLLFGAVAPAQSIEARLGVRLLRSLAKAHPVTIEAVVRADELLPLQLDPLTIVTSAEPNFAIGVLSSEPADAADPGTELSYALHLRNGGDGPAHSVSVRVERIDQLIYVPNSTTVNDVPVRDAGAFSALFSERGIVLSDVDPGIDAVIRWREVVHSACGSGVVIARSARIAYDGDRVETIESRELKVRGEPAFANAIAGLPFGLDGMTGPSLGGGRALSSVGDRFVALPAASPVAIGNGNAGQAPPSEGAVETAIAFDAPRLARTLRYLRETRFNAMVDHLFAIRAFFPDAVGSSDAAALRDLYETLREMLDRLFIKLRLPNYVLAPRDVETPGLREKVRVLAMNAKPGECPFEGNAVLSLRGSADVHELRVLSMRLTDAPMPSAIPWALLARLLPADVPEIAKYRGLLIASLDDLAGVNETALLETLAHRRYPVVDSALERLREQLSAAPA